MIGLYKSLAATHMPCCCACCGLQEACGVDVLAFEQSPGGEAGLAAAREAGAQALQEKVGVESG